MRVILLLLCMVSKSHLFAQTARHVDTLINIGIIQPEHYHYQSLSHYCDSPQILLSCCLLYRYDLYEGTEISATDINDVAWLRSGAYHQRRASIIFMENAKADGNLYILDGMYILQR